MPDSMLKYRELALLRPSKVFEKCCHFFFLDPNQSVGQVQVKRSESQPIRIKDHCLITMNIYSTITAKCQNYGSTWPLCPTTLRQLNIYEFYEHKNTQQSQQSHNSPLAPSLWAKLG